MYILTENEKIIALSDTAYDGFVWTDRDLVYTYDGRIVDRTETETKDYKAAKAAHDAAESEYWGT